MAGTMKYILLLLLLIMQTAYSINADPTPLVFEQPDGTEIRCFQRGDEWSAWYETPAGWSITKSPGGYWVYAIGKENHHLIPGAAIAGRDNPPAFSIDGSPLKKHLSPDPRIQMSYSPDFQLNSARTDTFLLPLLLVDFSDMPAVYPDSIFDQIMNSPDYSHPGHPSSGSFREFYLENSYGQFDPISDVVNWVQAPQPHDYYAYSNPDGYDRVLTLIRAAVDTAEARGMDWSIYDNDGDGTLDALNVLHAGEGAEQGDHSNIWSHKWYLSAGGLEVQYDGVWIDGYTMNPEIQSNNIVAIGVISHEFGHALGLPDLYDTDYSSSGAGKLALMASGSWGTYGSGPWHPSSLNAWCKTRLGWSDPVLLEDDQLSIELEQSFTSNQIYRINHPQDVSEYWLIENRNPAGNEIELASPGMVIWHIDTEMTNGWGVNNHEPHYGVGLEQADGYFDLENNGSSDAGDSYPGSTVNRAFTNNSSPSTVSHYGMPSMVTIENISDPDSIMTFDLSFGEILTASMNVVGSSGAAYDTGAVSISMDNTMPLNSLSFNLTSTPGILTVLDVEPGDRVSADSIIISGNMIEFVNPVVDSGSGSIMSISLFANTSIQQTVALEPTDFYSSDTAGNEVALLVTGGFYQVHPISQTLSMENTEAPIGGPFSYDVYLENTVPLKMINLTMVDAPDFLIAGDELFTDTNGNNQWDEGESFSDWNEDGVWTPAIQVSDRLAGWNHSMNITAQGITFSAASWTNFVQLGDGPIFTINGVVDNSAFTSTVTIRLEDVLLMDMYGNNPIPYTTVNGYVTVTPYVGTENSEQLPQEFSLSENYPNPFNPSTTLHYSVPQQDRVGFTVFDIRGNVCQQVNIEQAPGRYTFTWNGENFNGEAVASGTYFIRMSATGFTAIQKVLLIK